MTEKEGGGYTDLCTREVGSEVLPVEVVEQAEGERRTSIREGGVERQDSDPSHHEIPNGNIRQVPTVGAVVRRFDLTYVRQENPGQHQIESSVGGEDDVEVGFPSVILGSLPSDHATEVDGGDVDEGNASVSADVRYPQLPGLDDHAAGYPDLVELTDLHRMCGRLEQRVLLLCAGGDGLDGAEKGIFVAHELVPPEYPPSIRRYFGPCRGSQNLSYVSFFVKVFDRSN